MDNLSYLIQVAVVTGCYERSDELCYFLLTLRRVLTEYQFTGSIFYLGSQIVESKQMESLAEAKPLTICFSLEAFERRDLLHDKKRAISLQGALESMNCARMLGYEVTFSCIVGIEPLPVMKRHFLYLKKYINKFPIINTLQMHKYHRQFLVDPEAHSLEYYLETRQVLERLFAEESMRPQVWEDYRSLWFLTFNGEPLHGIRTPY